MADKLCMQPDAALDSHGMEERLNSIDNIASVQQMAYLLDLEVEKLTRTFPFEQ